MSGQDNETILKQQQQQQQYNLRAGPGVELKGH